MKATLTARTVAILNIKRVKYKDVRLSRTTGKPLPPRRLINSGPNERQIWVNGAVWENLLDQAGFDTATPDDVFVGCLLSFDDAEITEKMIKDGGGVYKELFPNNRQEAEFRTAGSYPQNFRLDTSNFELPEKMINKLKINYLSTEHKATMNKIGATAQQPQMKAAQPQIAGTTALEDKDEEAPETGLAGEGAATPPVNEAFPNLATDGAHEGAVTAPVVKEGEVVN